MEEKGPGQRAHREATVVAEAGLAVAVEQARLAAVHHLCVRTHACTHALRECPRAPKEAKSIGSKDPLTLVHVVHDSGRISESVIR